MTDRNDDRSIFDRLRELGDPELVVLLRQNHTIPEHRDPLFSEVLARLLVRQAVATTPTPVARIDPTWPKTKAEEAFLAKHDI